MEEEGGGGIRGKYARELYSSREEEEEEEEVHILFSNILI